LQGEAKTQEERGAQVRFEDHLLEVVIADMKRLGTLVHHKMPSVREGKNGEVVLTRQGL
jgi:hypothetical protein